MQRNLTQSMNTRFKFIFTLISTLFTLTALSQTGTVRGFVYDKASGEPVLFTNVVIKETMNGVSTDVNGFYQITGIKPGTYTLIVSNVQYNKLEKSITIKANDIVTENLYLEEGSEVMKELEVNAEKEAAKTKVKISVIKATSKEIKAVPAIGGEADIATYFQTVPGVVTTGDQGGQMYVRGGSPVQNKVLLDGMTIYNPFHSIGFFSVFDTDIIRSADIYTGGFSAQYGGRISSIMDITTKDGNRKELDGRVAVNPFGAKLMLNGPIKKLGESGSSISYVFSGKTSYLQQTSKVLYNYIDTAGLPFNYTDLYGKVSVNGANGSKLNVFGFNFRDKVKWQSLSDLNWNSWGVGTNYVIVPGNSPVLIGGKFNISNYQISMASQDPVTGQPSLPKTSSIGGFNLGFDFKYFMKDDEIKYGIDIVGFATDLSFYNSVNRQITQHENTTQLAGYFDYKIVRGRLVLNPSFRAQYYASLTTFSPEPRLGVKYNVSENFRLKAAGGIYSQNLISANPDRDVVNLFYGFLSGPDNLPNSITLQNGKVKQRKNSLQKATHAVFGAEYDIGKHVTLNIEGFYKWFNQLTNINRNKIYDDTPDNYNIPDVLKKDFILETGSAKGVDMVFKYTSKRSYIWFVYSLQKVDRWDGIKKYSPIFDRRHTINFIATHYLDKDKKWEMNARWNLGTGLPFTQTQGFYQPVTFANGVNSNVATTNSNNLGVLYAPMNLGRLPAYHRLDLTLKRTFELKENSKIEVTASVTNVYSRQNVFYVNQITNKVVHQLPILPSLGISWTF